MISGTDKAIIRILQEDMPLVREPYRLIADELGISEKDLLLKIKEFYDAGIIRRIGIALNHRKAGFHANAMVVWKVPEEKVEEVGMYLASLDHVSHCYQRTVYPSWPYNIFTMIHGKTSEECEGILKYILSKIGDIEHEVLYSTKEIKKSTMKYFAESK